MNESEEILIGGFMWNQGKELLVQTRSEWFINPKCGILLEVLQKMDRENIPMDYVSIINTAKRITNYDYYQIYSSYSGQSLFYHWGITKQRWTARKGKEYFAKLSEQFETSDPFEVLKEAQCVIDNLQLNRSGEFVPVQKLLQERVDSLDHRRKQEVKTVGHSTGFKTLDKYTGGFVPGELIIVAGRPGMGKSAFAVSLAISHARQGGKVVFFSLEMSKESIGDRLISMVSKIDNMRVRRADVSDHEMDRLKKEIPEQKYEFLLETSSSITIDQIRARVKIMNPLPTAVVIDYMQLVHSESKKAREQEIAYISRQCKLIAKDCGITVVALSQLNREAEEGNARPKLRHLRESGAIEQDADVVMFPFRPQLVKDDGLEDVEKDCELIIAKCRNGMTGSIEMWFRGSTTEYLW